MKSSLYVVIMAGGTGTRLWPVSRQDKPKQFHDLLGVGKTMLQLTYDRFRKICPAENIFVVTNQRYEKLVAEQLPEICSDQILGEPIKRNTAPCIAYAAYKIVTRDPEATMVVSPADHLILNDEAFQKAILEGAKGAEQNDCLVTLGIKPSRPETGYGYIQYIPGRNALKKVKTFTEKPELPLAQKFLESGDFVWNAGIFIWSVKTVINAFERHLPDLAEIFKEGEESFFSPKEKDFVQHAYAQSTSISVDYGIMEKADNVFVVLGDFGWSDLGNWESLHELSDKGEDGLVAGKNVLAYESHNCIVHVPDDRLVVIKGLDGYVVAEEENALLICPKEAERELRDIVSDVKKKKGEQFL